MQILSVICFEGALDSGMSCPPIPTEFSDLQDMLHSLSVSAEVNWGSAVSGRKSFVLMGESFLLFLFGSIK